VEQVHGKCCTIGHIDVTNNRFIVRLIFVNRIRSNQTYNAINREFECEIHTNYLAWRAVFESSQRHTVPLYSRIDFLAAPAASRSRHSADNRPWTHLSHANVLLNSHRPNPNNRISCLYCSKVVHARRLSASSAC
jgi:hypothetical protein